MSRAERILRWLYPGIGVKRWAGLAVIGALIATVGFLAWVGRDLVRTVYEYLSPNQQSSYWIAAILIIVGLAVIVLGVNRTVHAIVKGIAPETEGRTSEILYSHKRLSRGPQIVAVGGGTGLSSLLRGLKTQTSNTTAVVTVMDDGGSSGRLREEMNMLPPGDIRNCLIALAEDESEIAALFKHRFQNGSGSLNGHSLGNLVLAGLQQHTGRFDVAIEKLSHILKVRGQVVPTTLEDVKLVAEMEDGAIVTGEVAVTEDSRSIRQMSLSQAQVKPYHKVLHAISEARIIILGPGSLFTSIIPNLLVEGVSKAIERSNAIKIYVANLMTQPGETDGFSLSDHIRVLGQYLNVNALDYVIANDKLLPERLEEQYDKEDSIPIALDDISHLTTARLVTTNLCDIVELDGKSTIKHDAEKLTSTIFQCAR